MPLPAIQKQQILKQPIRPKWTIKIWNELYARLKLMESKFTYLSALTAFNDEGQQLTKKHKFGRKIEAYPGAIYYIGEGTIDNVVTDGLN
eukprot:583350-Ditylum_brightwellii.AAC.1